MLACRANHSAIVVVICLNGLSDGSTSPLLRRRGIWFGALFGKSHYFTLNGEYQRDFIDDFFVPELDDIDVDDHWF